MALRTFSTSDLLKEIERREKAGEKLLAQRDKLAQEIDALDAELSALGLAGDGPRRRGRKPGRAARRGRKPGRKPGRRPGRKPGRKPGPKAGRSTGRKRARNAMSLPDAIASAVKMGAVVAPQDVAAQVRKGGFKTTSKNFNMMVSNALAKDKRFKRLSRGQYERVK